MKNRIRSTVVLAAVMILLAGCLIPGPVTGESVSAVAPEYAALAEQLRTVQDFKFLIHKEGIGFGNCPVYTAPSEYAYRAGNGRAACDTNGNMRESGFVDGCLLVCYEMSNGGFRVGYIPRKYLPDYKAGMSAPKFSAIPITVAEAITVTDDPIKKSPGFATLFPGDSVSVLAKYTYNGNWYYIEFMTEGMIARGFIDRDQLSFYLGGVPADPSVQPLTLATLGSPEVSPRGTAWEYDVLIIEGGSSSRKNVRQNPNRNAPQITVVYPGRTYACYGMQEGSSGINWYYIWVEQDSEWGWVASTYVSVVR